MKRRSLLKAILSIPFTGVVIGKSTPKEAETYVIGLGQGEDVPIAGKKRIIKFGKGQGDCTFAIPFPNRCVEIIAIVKGESVPYLMCWPLSCGADVSRFGFKLHNSYFIDFWWQAYGY